MDRDPHRSAVAIDPETVARFRSDGAVCLRGVLDPDWIARLREGVERAIAAPGHLGKIHTREGEPGRFFVDSFMNRRFDVFRRFALESPAASVARALLGAARVRFFHDHLLVKEPGTADRTPWHQDQPYFPTRGAAVCSLWFPLDRVTRDSGAVEYVRGSHRWGKIFGAVSVNEKTKDQWAGATHEPVPDIDNLRDRLEFLCWDTAPGDCIAHDALALHGAGGNATGDRRRRALAMRYAGEGVTFDPRPGTMDLGADPGLASGAPLDGPLFPAA